MGRCKLWFLFLLRLTICSCNEGRPKQNVKTISKEDDFTPACSNVTLHLIGLLVCRIRPERSREEECRLTYQRKKGFEQKCDSRFSLVTINQTVFLHLSNLTPDNSGKYTCDCSYNGGMFFLQLNISVEGNNVTINPTETTPHRVKTGVPVLIGFIIIIVVIIAVVILGVVWSIKRHRRRREAIITTGENTEMTNVEPYSVFMQKKNSLYLTSINHTSASRNHLNLPGADNRGFGAPL